MRRIGVLLAVMALAVMLAGGVVLAATAAQAPPEQARFRVTLNGFYVDKETWDHALEVDGKGDEVFVRYDTRLVSNEGTTLSESSQSTKVMGDINGYPERVQAGSRSSKGGLKTGDSFPTSSPWQHDGNLMADRPPMKLFEGNLVEGETGVAITPTLFVGGERYSGRTAVTQWT